MSKPALRLIEHDSSAEAAELPLTPLWQHLKPGRIIELSGNSTGGSPSARMTTAVDAIYRAQLEGETTAWIQPRGGALFPPDLELYGVDLEALIVVHVPRRADVDPHLLCKAAEVLLRSGAFGLVVIDLCDGAPSNDAWQGRLLGLARQHHCRIIILTEKPSTSDSLGPLIGLRLEPRRNRPSESKGPHSFHVAHEVLKNKSGAPIDIQQIPHRGPWGLS